MRKVQLEKNDILFLNFKSRIFDYKANCKYGHMLTVIFKKLKPVLQAAMFEDKDSDDEYYF